MRKYIYILIAVLLSSTAFAQYNKQVVGSLIRPDTSLFRTKVFFDSSVYYSPLAGGDATGKALIVDGSGKLGWKTTLLEKSDTSRSGIVSTYFYVDSLYTTIGTHDSLVKYSDSLTGVYATGHDRDTLTDGVYTAIGNIPVLDTTSLSDRINTKIPYTDTGGAYFPTKYFLLNNYISKNGNSFGAGTTIGTNDAFYFALKANNTEALRIFSATRNIGIGTTTDITAYKLNVNGSVRVGFLDNLTAGIAFNVPAGSAAVIGTITNSGHTLTLTKGNNSGATGLRVTDQNIASNNNHFFIDFAGSAGFGFLATASVACVPSALIEARSTTKGILPTRMTQAQRDAIASPATALEIFCTDCTATDASVGVKQSWNGTAWKNYW